MQVQYRSISFSECNCMQFDATLQQFENISVFNKTNPIVDYGNIGCGVFKGGIQN